MKDNLMFMKSAKNDFTNLFRSLLCIIS